MRYRGVSARGALGWGIVCVILGLGGPTLTASARQPAAGSPSSATSAMALGGMQALITAAKKEGRLNVVALPPDWANYGKIIAAFEHRYGIKVTSAIPDGNSQDEINQALRLHGQRRAPDVFDLGLNVALANTAMFAPYKVATWGDIASNLKDPTGTWFADYGGYSSIGYDPAAVPAPKTINDLLGPAYRGKVALNGDPTKSSSGYHGVMLAALANGGSADNIAPGVAFFKKLKAAGNFLPVDPTPATIASGATPVVIDWEYLNAGYAKEFVGKRKWTTVVPAHDLIGAFYVQAINKDAPDAAAARLWEEFLYSDQGQTLWLQGLARPVRLQAMLKAGTVDRKDAAALPAAVGKPVILTPAQIKKGQAYLQQTWSAAVSG